MKVLIACEFSGIVRDAFIKKGHVATSCDFEDTESPGPHLKCDVRDLDIKQYDMLLAFPPCTYLAVSGARWWKNRKEEQELAINFVEWLITQKIKKIAIENPIGKLSTAIRKPDQIIQPWQYGHGETKATCLWLKGLPKLYPTAIADGREHHIHRMAPSKDRSKNRSRTFQGIANAMAEQWG